MKFRRLPGIVCEGLGDDIIVGRSLPVMNVTETGEGFTITVPLHRIDARNVYVFATPRSIAVEIRIRDVVSHAQVIHREIQHQRITRELVLREAIEEGSTSLRLHGDDLQITCRKASGLDDKTWSELVRLDTRCSLGSV